MLRKGAITLAQPTQNQFLSNIFLTPKKNGAFRPVVNLKSLNQIIPYCHFKMEGIRQVKEMLLKGDYMVKIDLTDAFYNIPLHKESQELVRFLWRGNMYQFLCLCFWISPAPRIFTKIMKIPVSILRRLNIRIVIYLDDFILMGRSLKEILIARETTIFLLQHLGLIINLEKSNLTPSTTMEFLGILIDSIRMTLLLPREKVNKIISNCQQIQKSYKITLRDLASLIGTLNSSAHAILPAPLQYRYLQDQLIGSLAKCTAPIGYIYRLIP